MEAISAIVEEVGIRLEGRDPAGGEEVVRSFEVVVAAVHDSVGDAQDGLE